MNLEAPGTWTDISRAAVLLLAAVSAGTNPTALRRATGYPWTTIRRINDNLRKNGIWTHAGGLAYFSEDPEKMEPTAQAVEFTLLAMAGAGILNRTTP